MVMNVLLLYLICHHIGDYFLQFNFIAKKKPKSYFYTFLHVLLYAIPFFFVWLTICRDNAFLIAILIICISHYPIDCFKVYTTIHSDFLFKNRQERPNLLYILDQVLHMGFIITGAFIVDRFAGAESMSIIYHMNTVVLNIMFFAVMMYQGGYVTNKLIRLSFPIYDIFDHKEISLKIEGMIFGLIIGFTYYKGVALLLFVLSYRRFMRHTINDERYHKQMIDLSICTLCLFFLHMTNNLFMLI